MSMMSTNPHFLSDACILSIDPLQRLEELINSYFNEDPTRLKIAIFANHFFITVANLALMVMLPCSMPTNIAFCFIASLFYRVTVEKDCAHKLALLSFSGAAISLVLINEIEKMTGELIFASIVSPTLFLSILSIHVSYVMANVDYEVDSLPCHRP